MNIQTEAKKTQFFIGISYIWIVGTILSILTTENFTICSSSEKIFTEIILFSNVFFFIIGCMHSFQKKYTFPRLLKFYNNCFQILCLVLCILGAIVFFSLLDENQLCKNVYFLNNFLTLTYAIVFGFLFGIILILCILEFLVVLFYVFKAFAYCFYNSCCCCFNCLFPYNGGKKIVYENPHWKIYFIKYIPMVLFLSNNQKESNVNPLFNGAVIENSGLSDAEQKKIILAL